ncbi:hypothetical protein FBU30_001949 [Linnemannia zychae]|nr:hypothetical protein FBU30_001949 [Linnemannia zychae]
MSNNQGTTNQGDTSNNGPFRLLQFNSSCTNCENIFKAVMFLQVRLPEKAHLLDETYVFGFTKDSPSFKDLATELREKEPSLRGVTPLALLSLYERIIKERKALDEFLAKATGFSWTDTRMSDMALDLVNTDRELRDRDNRQQASKSDAKMQIVTEAQNLERQVVMAMLGTLGGRKRMIEEDEDEEVDDNVDAASANYQQISTLQAVSAPAITSILDQLADDPSNIQSGPLQQKSHSLSTQSTMVAQTQIHHQSSASESLESDPLSPTLKNNTPKFTRPTPRFKKRSLTVESDRISTLTNRMEELEAQNRQLRMDVVQLKQQIQPVISDSDEFQVYKRKNIQTTQSLLEVTESLTQLQGQIKTVQTQFNMLRGQINQTDLDISDLAVKTRRHDNRISSKNKSSNQQIKRLNIDDSGLIPKIPRRKVLLWAGWSLSKETLRAVISTKTP